MRVICEALVVGEHAGGRAEITQMKIADKTLLDRIADLVALNEAARDRGFDAQPSVEPYTRRDNLVARLKNLAVRDRMRRSISSGLPGLYDQVTAVGAGKGIENVVSDRWLLRLGTCDQNDTPAAFRLRIGVLLVGISEGSLDFAS